MEQKVDVFFCETGWPNTRATVIMAQYTCNGTQDKGLRRKLKTDKLRNLAQDHWNFAQYHWNFAQYH